MNTLINGFDPLIKLIQQSNNSLFNTHSAGTTKERTTLSATLPKAYREGLERLARERLATEEGQKAYRNRYRIEQKVADLTRYCGLRRCRYRGLARASGPHPVGNHGLQYQADGDTIMGEAGQLLPGIVSRRLDGENQAKKW